MNLEKEAEENSGFDFANGCFFPPYSACVTHWNTRCLTSIFHLVEHQESKNLTISTTNMEYG